MPNDCTSDQPLQLSDDPCERFRQLDNLLIQLVAGLNVTTVRAGDRIIGYGQGASSFNSRVLKAERDRAQMMCQGGRFASPLAHRRRYPAPGVVGGSRYRGGY